LAKENWEEVLKANSVDEAVIILVIKYWIFLTPVWQQKPYLCPHINVKDKIKNSFS
jgi:hypothetical protein